MTTWAKLTISVMALTATPASTPTPIASATSPSSLARRRARNLAMRTSAGRGVFIETPGRMQRSCAACPDLCATCRPKPRAAASAARQRHVVAMDHFGAARRPEEMGDIARVAPADAFGMQGVESDQAPPDFRPALIADGDAVAAREGAFDPGDAGRQQALAPVKRGGGAGVDEHGAFQLERAADPDLARRDRIRRGEEPGAAPALGHARDRMHDPPVGDDHVGPGRGRDAGGLDLGA